MYGTGRIRSLIIVDQPSACVVLPWMTAEEGGQAGAILDFPAAEAFVRAIAEDDRATRDGFLKSMLTRTSRPTTWPGWAPRTSSCRRRGAPACCSTT